jgi:hypothetical protein
LCLLDALVLVETNARQGLASAHCSGQAVAQSRV